ncbi:hypothetical protein [Chromohalobacter israelensis]|uniref:hypothetical protein n=1 Tax=Chromohalobacter israelensis TaxID=141390 RepID=UPI00265C530B|nr:hypothetical protein [Chromohalobacter salexigens]MDO0944630.1 hypothetical protein [Chromohalobacter salexigens]
MKSRYRAYCFATGEIGTGIATPAGAIEIATGSARDLKTEIEVVARLAYDNETLLVPGVPEAADQQEALDALCQFVDWAGDRFMAKRVWHTSDEIRENFASMTRRHLEGDS